MDNLISLFGGGGGGSVDDKIDFEGNNGWVFSFEANGYSSKGVSIDIKQKVIDLIKDGKFLDAVNAIIDFYPQLKSLGQKYYQIGVAPGVNTTSAPITIEDISTGDLVTYCDVIISQELVAGFPNGNSSFGQLVRSIYHELIHVAQFFGVNGQQKLNRVEEDRPQREFLASYSSLTDKTLPPMLSVENSFFARINFGFQKIMTDKGPKQFGNYYNRLPPALQQSFSAKAVELKKLIDTTFFRN